ncbi:hypothetical protein KJ830_09460, partial [bacterium]|nr:hypothetical protein [bacterium]
GHCENCHCEASSSVIARSKATKQSRITLNNAKNVIARSKATKQSRITLNNVMTVKLPIF